MKKILSVILLLMLIIQFLPSSDPALAADVNLIVARIAIYPMAPKVGEKADISVFVQNIGNTSVNLNNFSVDLLVADMELATTKQRFRRNW